MSQAFSFLITEDCHARWKFGMDWHEDIIAKAKFRDDGHTFARCEITPKNGSYLASDEWVFRMDEKARPKWWTPAHEAEAWRAWKDWKKQLDKILVYKPIVHTFKEIMPPNKIMKQHLALLKKWDLVWASVWPSVSASVRASIGDSVGDSIAASIEASIEASIVDSIAASIWTSVGTSIEASIWAYVGSFFDLPRNTWKYTENIMGEGYPFQPAVDLWMMGLIPSFDGATWRLHGGPDGKILWEGRTAFKL